MVNSPKAVHFKRESGLRKMTTLQNAVVRIFSWYVTWKVAASRLVAATYCKLF